MITEADIFAGIRLGIAVLLIWAFYFWVYRNFRSDHLRERLFEMRDGLFETTREMGISFDEPAYVMIRDSLNGLLRFAHRVSLFGLIGAYWGWKKYPRASSSFTVDLMKALNQIENQEYRQAILNTHARMLWTIYIHVVTGAPILFLYVATKIMVLVGVQVWRKILQILHTKIKNLRDLRLPSFREFGALLVLGFKRLGELLIMRAPGSSTVPLAVREWGRVA
jgi:hypothetical protein